ncbi:hypothetical protein KY332_02950 [Candidatus Woesearchaeota archaeon]|nr:hypothetical protein [Candidatus Woesearchaeota archaeon]
MKKLIKHSAKEKFLALLSYLGNIPFLFLPLFLIPLLMKKDNKWIHQHAKQGLVFYIGFIVLTWIPLLGWIWGIYLVITGIIAIIKVLTGTLYWKIPLIGSIAEKIHI